MNSSTCTYDIRLIIMRIRFRASGFGLVPKICIIRAKSKQASCAEMVLGSVVRFFARVIQLLDFWTRKIQANVDHCYVRRRAECTSLGPGLKHPSTLVWPRRDVPRLHVVFFFRTESEPST